MTPFPPQPDLLQRRSRPLSSYDRELAAIEESLAHRPRREPLLKRFALRHLFRDGAPTPSAGEITIRRATAADRPALRRLAELDGRAPADEAALVAEVDRRIVATVSLDSGEPIADPFHARRDVVELLQVRAAQLAA